MRDLVQSARIWIQLERQAFRISDDRDRNTASAIDEMTEEELEASLREDMRILNLLPNPEPEKRKVWLQSAEHRIRQGPRIQGLAGHFDRSASASR